LKKPLVIFLGLRYLRPRHASQYVSFVTIASVLGVMLGVAALIVVMSVMNGFENELRDRLLSMTSHASVSSSEGLADWQAVSASLESESGVVATAPYVEMEAMLSTGRDLAGAIVTGVDPAAEARLTGIDQNLISGDFDSLTAGSGNIILGSGLARHLGVVPGQRVTVLVPQRGDGPGGFRSNLRRLLVTGVFEMGLQDHDSVRALIHISDAREIQGIDAGATGVRIRLDDIFAAPELMRAWQQANGEAYTVSDWTVENASYFRAVRIEKIMMALLLSLIIGVAAFNIVASLVMVVTEKRAGIAILRTMGCSRSTIVGVFVFQGTMIGWLGCLCGIALGVWLALNIDSLAPALESVLGFQFMPADLYYLTALPSDLHAGDVVWTSVAVLFMTIVATIYPALRAAGVEPAEVLRYE